MCRWVAYAGPEIYLEDILFNQSNSISSQSYSAKESVWTTNGDGFGVAWYTQRTTAGLFKDVLPAWNDNNLRSLAAHIRTNLFFAHVRATTGTSISRSNCHPFIWKNWTFMHNGQIGGWKTCRKEYESHISHDYFSLRDGSTDSEAIFLLALTLGLPDNPIKAITQAIEIALQTMDKYHIQEPLRASIAVSNGQSIWAFRYSNDANSPSLYFGNPQTQANAANHLVTTIASEPLDAEAKHWQKVEEASAIIWNAAAVEHQALRI
ncbi:MAG: class II glutamine amidotransferase [Burkholderiaceae bacterium]|nr:class II glutamine amidotransferase [Burkholderiaceae bacterium]